MLSPCSTKAAEGIGGDVVAPLNGDFFNGIGHLVDGNGQVPRRYLFWRALVSGFGGNSVRQRRKLVLYLPLIQGQVSLGAKDLGKERRWQFSQHHIAVGHRQRSPLAIAGGTGMGTRRLWSHPVAGSIKGQN